jgi:hypothetical protein
MGIERPVTTIKMPPVVCCVACFKVSEIKEPRDLQHRSQVKMYDFRCQHCRERLVLQLQMAGYSVSYPYKGRRGAP